MKSIINKDSLTIFIIVSTVILMSVIYAEVSYYKEQKQEKIIEKQLIDAYQRGYSDAISNDSVFNPYKALSIKE